MRGATWQEDIGRIAEMLHPHGRRARPCSATTSRVTPRAIRVLVNSNGEPRRLAITLGLDPNISTEGLMDWFEHKMDSMAPHPRALRRRRPDSGERRRGRRHQRLKFPAPFWHQEDGGRYIGTGTRRHHQGPRQRLDQHRDLPGDGPQREAGRPLHLARQARPHPPRQVLRPRRADARACSSSAATRVFFVASSLEIAPGVNELEWVGGLRGEPVEVITRQVHGPAHSRRTPRSCSRASPHPNTSCWRARSASGPATTPAAVARGAGRRREGGLPPQRPGHPRRAARRSRPTRPTGTACTCARRCSGARSALAGVPDVVARLVPRRRRLPPAERGVDQAALPRPCAPGWARRGDVPRRRLPRPAA